MYTWVERGTSESNVPSQGSKLRLLELELSVATMRPPIHAQEAKARSCETKFF